MLGMPQRWTDCGTPLRTAPLRLNLPNAGRARVCVASPFARTDGRHPWLTRGVRSQRIFEDAEASCDSARAGRRPHPSIMAHLSMVHGAEKPEL